MFFQILIPHAPSSMHFLIVAIVLSAKFFVPKLSTENVPRKVNFPGHSFLIALATDLWSSTGILESTLGEMTLKLLLVARVMYVGSSEFICRWTSVFGTLLKSLKE